MKIICPECEYVINRDKIIEGQMAEEYKNIYGTNCPKCGAIIKPITKPNIIDKKELDTEILRNKMRDRIKEKIKWQ